MSRTRAIIVAAVVTLGACAGPGTAVMPSEGSASHSSAGKLNVEPFAIIFHRGKSQIQSVRVWQQGYRGSYTAVNKCAGVTVSLERVTQHNNSIWNVRPVARERESCVVEFYGGGGKRGTGDLDIRVHR
jgi:hypothetical protein